MDGYRPVQPRGWGGFVRQGDKVGVSQQRPPAPPCSTNNRLGDEGRPESGWLISLPEREMV